MDENKRKRINNMIRILSLVVLALFIGCLIWATQAGKLTSTAYHIMICCALFAFWVLNDVICPVVTKEFDDRTPEQISAYRTYALLNLAGYAGLAFFAISVGNNNGIYGALVFAVTMMYKKRFLNRYLGIEEESGNDEDEEEEPETAQIEAEENAEEPETARTEAEEPEETLTEPEEKAALEDPAATEE